VNTQTDVRVAHAGRYSNQVPHRREIDNQSFVAGRVAGDVVPSSPNRDVLDSVIGRKRNGREHVASVGTTHDRQGSLVDHSVPDSPGYFVVGVLGQDDLASNVTCQPLEVRALDDH